MYDPLGALPIKVGTVVVQLVEQCISMGEVRVRAFKPFSLARKERS